MSEEVICPRCGSKDVDIKILKHPLSWIKGLHCKCKNCGREWDE